MNYLKEILAFHTWLETNQLDTAEQALWFHLMEINNKCGWAEWFAVANMTLQARLGIDRKTLDRKRTTLINKGRIQYKNQGKREAGKYRLISFEDVSRGNIPLETGLSVPNNVPKVSLGVSTLNKQNKTNNNNNAHDKNIFTVFEQELARPLSPMETERMRQWSAQLSNELIIEALRRAVLMGKANFRYIDAIILEWQKNNIRTVSEAREKDKQFLDKGKRQKRKTEKPDVDHERDERKKMFDSLLMS